METIYHWIGFIIFWLSAIIGTLTCLGFLCIKLLNVLAEYKKTMWIVVEFAYYKQQFLEWVKDKERIKKH